MQNELIKVVPIALVLSFCGSLANGAPDARRNWDLNPAVVQVDTVADVYAIGDVHGDPGPLVAVLKASGIINRQTPAKVKPTDVHWLAGKSILVVLGDMIDKGPNSLGVIAILRALQTSAAAAGGRVILLMGNHELEFLADPHGDKTSDFGDELKQAGLKPNDVADCQDDLGKFLCELPIAARVNDWFFSHAGNTKGRTIAALSAAIKSGFAQNGFATKELNDDNSILEARLNDRGPEGLAWFYEGSLKTDPQAVLRRNATALGVNHIVQGHQPGEVVFGDPDNIKNGDVIRKENAIFQRYGLLFLLDTGMSSGVDGKKSRGGVLRINRAGQRTGIAVDGKSSLSPAVYFQVANVICANGATHLLWDARNNEPVVGWNCR